MLTNGASCLAGIVLSQGFDYFPLVGAGKVCIANNFLAFPDQFVKRLADAFQQTSQNATLRNVCETKMKIPNQPVMYTASLAVEPNLGQLSMVKDETSNIHPESSCSGYPSRDRNRETSGSGGSRSKW